MVWKLLRGVCSIAAATTGLLLVYGLEFAMEGVTTRIPINPVRELANVTLWMLPWVVLYSSGLEDLVTVTGRVAIFWVGVALALAFLYYNERHTSESLITKGAMPLLVTVAGLLPHVLKRIRFLFTVCSLLAGIAGVVVLYYVLYFSLSGSSSFASKETGIIVVGFGVAAVATSVLSGVFLWRAKKLFMPENAD